MILIPPVLLILISSFYYSFPPKRINYWYGYRTSYSMQNQAIWDYSNKVAAKYLLIFSIALFVFDVILETLISHTETAKAISFFAIILGLAATITLIEIRIRKP